MDTENGAQRSNPYRTGISTKLLCRPQPPGQVATIFASLPAASPSILSSVASTSLIFPNRDAHRAWLLSQAKLPAGFRVGCTRFEFVPREAPKPAKMTLTLIALDKPTEDFAAVFTRNALPGAPILVGRKRLNEKQWSAVVINNKISNVCATDGELASEQVCARTAELLGVEAKSVLPSSTGVIGWGLPVDAMLCALPEVLPQLQGQSILPAAEGIVTTDLYPKIRRIDLGGGSIVGIAKGAGMIEPNLATMLVYILTDLAVPREELRAMLKRVVQPSFNSISIDSDTSTSDTVALLSSSLVPCSDLAAFETGLAQVCQDLAEDVVRNGEGVRHVIRMTVNNAPDVATARQLGKAIVNAPLFKCAVAGNDPNVGRLVQAIGKYVGAEDNGLELSRLQLHMGGIELFAHGVFKLDPAKEKALAEHLHAAELYQSAPPVDGVFSAAVDYPPHERCVEITVDLGSGDASATVFGGDLTHEYVSENADYRS
jgi:glutamate N-acetyltransferase / amino-acid N-acetyltransferase